MRLSISAEVSQHGKFCVKGQAERDAVGQPLTQA